MLDEGGLGLPPDAAELPCLTPCAIACRGRWLGRNRFSLKAGNETNAGAKQPPDALESPGAGVSYRAE